MATVFPTQKSLMDYPRIKNFISSVRSSSGYHGLLHPQQQATFSNFSNSSDSKVKVKVKGPNMCYIFALRDIGKLPPII